MFIAPIGTGTSQVTDGTLALWTGNMERESLFRTRALAYLELMVSRRDAVHGNVKNQHGIPAGRRCLSLAEPDHFSCRRLQQHLAARLGNATQQQLYMECPGPCNNLLRGGRTIATGHALSIKIQISYRLRQTGECAL